MKLTHYGWRMRFCAIGFCLGLYLVVSALVSTHGGVSFPAPYDMNGLAVVEVPFTSPSRSRAAAEALALHKAAGSHNLAFNIQRGGGGLSPRRMRGMSGPQIEWCKYPLGYKAAPGPVTALASFPGSGNTWLRYLLQQATGLLTGSVYKDYALLKNGFPGENVVNGSVLAVKTHEFGPDSRKAFDRVILLVRDPFSSLKAEFNRRSGGHVGHASLDRYKRSGGKHWRNFVNSKGPEWERMNMDWFNGFHPDDRKVIFYDHLQEDPIGVLRSTLDFLGVSVSNATLSCVNERKEGIYKRPKKKLKMDVFSDEMKSLLAEKQRTVFALLDRPDYTNEYSSYADLVSASEEAVVQRPFSQQQYPSSNAGVKKAEATAKPEASS